MTDYDFTHAARADLLRRLERKAEALAAYQQALMRTEQAAQRRFILYRMGSL